MNKGRVLFNINSEGKNYCVYLSNSNQLNAFAYSKLEDFHFVKEPKEIEFINSIIKKLNKRYVRREEINYQDEKIVRFENIYSKLSYFAKADFNGTLKVCNYNDYSSLYEKYNGIKVDYDYLSYYDGRNSDGFFEEAPATSQRGRHKPGKIRKVIAIAGTIVTITLSALGVNSLIKGELPQVTAPETTITQTVEETKGTSEIVVGENQEKPEGIGNSVPEELEQPESDSIDWVFDNFGKVDLKADTSKKQDLRDNYKSIEEQLREQGLENWEICVALNDIAVRELKNMSFIYDGENDEIIYVYQRLPEKEKDNSSSETSIVPDNVQILLDAVKNNKYLTEDEKEFIIRTNKDYWVKNADKLDIEEIWFRLSCLKIEYHDGILDVDSSEVPGTSAEGYYKSSIISSSRDEIRDMINSGEIRGEKVSEIHISNFTKFDSEKYEQTFAHECNHIVGNFRGISILLNEGYTELSNPMGRFNNYQFEQLMAVMFIRTFGPEVMKDGYYGFDLENALVNKLVEVTKRDISEVEEEIFQLLKQVQSALYNITGRNHNMNKGLFADYIPRDELTEILDALSSYSELINGKPLKENAFNRLVIDALTGKRDAESYRSDDENINYLDFNVNTGEGNVMLVTPANYNYDSRKKTEYILIEGSSIGYDRTTFVHTDVTGSFTRKQSSLDSDPTRISDIEIDYNSDRTGEFGESQDQTNDGEDIYR